MYEHKFSFPWLCLWKFQKKDKKEIGERSLSNSEKT